jgi:hypothetical protein
MSGGPWIVHIRSGRPFQVSRAADLAPGDPFQESLSQGAVQGIMNALATEPHEALSRELYADMVGSRGKPHRGRLTEREWSAVRSAFERGVYVLVPLEPGTTHAPPLDLRARYTRDLSPGFFRGVKAMCGRLRCDPKDMLSVWLYESGVSSHAHNKNGHASGLCQIMPFNLNGSGWHMKDGEGKPDHAAFRALSAEQQLPYVEKYYSSYAGKLTDRVQCYVATFLPAFINSDKSLDFVLCRKDDHRKDLRDAYAANKGFDAEGKHYITRGDLAAAIDRAQTKLPLRWHEILDRLAQP